MLVHKKIIQYGISAIFLSIGLIFNLSFHIKFALFLIGYIVVGGEIILKTVKNILKGKVFDEYFLISIATIGAFSIGSYAEGVAVMLFYQIGELLQDEAVNRSRKSIIKLLEIRPDYANLKSGDEIKRVPPEEVKVGSIIVVKPGERIPLDGRVIEGSSMVDTSTLTGESVLREVYEGSEVLSGFINKNGILTVEVMREIGESTISKILKLFKDASIRKAATERFITKFTRYYTPTIVFLSLLKE